MKSQFNRKQLVAVVAAMALALPGLAADIDVPASTNITTTWAFTSGDNLYVGSNSVGVVMDVNSGGDVTNFRNFYIGSTASSLNNQLIVRGGGSTVSNDTSNNARLFFVGDSGSTNSMIVTNGGVANVVKGSGTNSGEIGSKAGANGNSVLVTGSGSLLTSAGMPWYVGNAGSGNTLTIEAGGYMSAQRLYMGTLGGDNNSVLVTGAGSTNNVASGSNSIMSIGDGVDAVNNTLTIANGGTFRVGTGQSNRDYAIGKSNGANDNVVIVTGAGSLFDSTHNNPLAIGGVAKDNVLTFSTATGNHLDVFDNAKATFTGSIYLMGTNSAVNIGNGSGVSTVSVGVASAFAGAIRGIYMTNTTATVKFNSGLLLPTGNGTLISGVGVVSNAGPAYIGTAGFTNSIDSVITGTGSLTKFDAGKLTLSQNNTYTGDTIVSNGTLSIAYAYLADASTVFISSTAILDLATGASDTVNAAFVNGVGLAVGTWGATGSGASNIDDTHFTGNGMLNVLTVVPEPNSMILAMLGLAGMMVLRRRRS